MYDAVRYYRMFCTSNSPRCEEISETYKDNDNYKRLTEFPYEKFIKLYVENKNKSKKEGEKKLTVDEQIVIDDKEKQNIIKKRYDDAKYYRDNCKIDSSREKCIKIQDSHSKDIEYMNLLSLSDAEFNEEYNFFLNQKGSLSKFGTNLSTATSRGLNKTSDYLKNAFKGKSESDKLREKGEKEKEKYVDAKYYRDFCKSTDSKKSKNCTEISNKYKGDSTFKEMINLSESLFNRQLDKVVKSQSFTGGAGAGRANKKKQIYHVTKRLNKTLHRFLNVKHTRKRHV